MKIYSETFRKWFKVLETYQDKGDQVRESIYLNFKDSYCYFSSSEGIGKLKFYFEKELDEEEIPNFFINTNKFLNIISQYDEINLNNKFVFSNGKDKYKIAVLVDDDLFDDSTINSDFNGSEIEFTKDQVMQINAASSFTNKDEQNINYRNIFIKDKHICSLTTQTPMYEAKFDSDIKVVVSLNTSKTINTVGMISEGCFLISSEKTSNIKILSRDRELEIIVAGCSSDEFPPNRTQNFIDSYTYNTIAKIETVKLSKALQSLRPYYNEVINTKVSFLFNDDDLLIKVSDTQNEIEKHVEVQECDEKLKNSEIFLSASKVEQILGVLKDPVLIMDIPTDDSRPIVNFWNDEKQHVLMTRFKS